MPDVLATFARRHPEVDIELRAGLSHDLYDVFDAGLLDVILVKRRTGDRRGTPVWQEAIRWIGHVDVRTDPGIAGEILEFIQEQGALSVVMTGGIIGCPHQEGIDYEGQWCPVCEFWHGRDRFTGNMIQ